MLSRDLRALAAWFGPVSRGEFEMTAEGARAFLENLERAAEDAEALEACAVVTARHGRVIRGPMPGNVVAFRSRPAPPAGRPTGGDAA